jgi:hypothetical protein
MFMDAISNGLVLLVNGFLTCASNAADWKVLAGIAMVTSLLWLARIESDEADLAGTKPYLPRG